MGRRTASKTAHPKYNTQFHRLTTTHCVPHAPSAGSAAGVQSAWGNITAWHQIYVRDYYPNGASIVVSGHGCAELPQGLMRSIRWTQPGPLGSPLCPTSCTFPCPVSKLVVLRPGHLSDGGRLRTPKATVACSPSHCQKCVLMKYTTGHMPKDSKYR